MLADPFSPPSRETVVSRSKLLTISLTSAFLLFQLVTEASAIPSWNKPCEKAYGDWKKKPGHKAFALTSVTLHGQSCGYSWSAPSKEAAEREAIKECKKGKFGMRSTCYIMESK